MKKILFLLLHFIICSIGLKAQTPEHKWVNETLLSNHPELEHKGYFSEIHQTEIGYTIAFPPGYHEKENAAKKYPVVYFFHGGNPGNENRTGYFNYIKPTNKIDSLCPIIYVWNNGGKSQSHYDFPSLNSYPETSFIKELIPHIDGNYRTIPERNARGLQGISMGGRAVARYIFKYPQLFSIAVSMAGDHLIEKNNAQNQDYEPDNNSWELAKIYAQKPKFDIKLHVFVGSSDKNFESNVAWSEYLRHLNIHHSFTVVEGVEHLEVKKMMKQIGSKTIHYMFYQSFEDLIQNYNNK